MSRHNSFNLVHKGLRSFLYDTAEKIQQADLSSTQSAGIIDQVSLVITLFESHAHNEDHFFNEPLAKLNPRVASLFMQEHEEDHRLSNVLSDLISSWRKASSPEKRSEVGRHLFYAFNEFIAFNLYHMNKEEIELNEVMWKEYSDVSIKATEQALVQSIPPEKMAVYAKWMLRGNNDADIIKWLTEVRDFAPAEVGVVLKSMASHELSAERYARIESAVFSRAAVV